MRRILLGDNDAQSVAYHNVQELDRGRYGLTLQRVPASWRDRFPEATGWRATQAAGVELRFRAATSEIALDLRTVNHIPGGHSLALYHGFRAVALRTLSDLTFRGQLVLLDEQEKLPAAPDAPWRILCPYGARTIVKALYLSDDAELLPLSPRPVRWLAYGDSITQGARALSPGMTYVHLVADALGWDGLNLGFGGAAWGDAVVAEYIASRDDWDLLSIAIGTNTFGGSVESPADFRGRYDRFLDIIRESYPSKPILCITPIWRHEDGPPEVSNDCGQPPNAYRQVVAGVVERRCAGDSNLGLLDGLQILGDARGLGLDRVHPDDHGMWGIANGVSNALRSLAYRGCGATLRGEE